MISEESTRKNFIYNIIYQMITVLSPLIVTRHISRAFGVDYLGIKGFTFSIVSYFAIAGTLGFDMYGQRQIAINKEDKEARSKAFSVVYCSKFLLVLISTIAYELFVLVFSGLEGVEKTVALCWSIYLVREMINPIWVLQGMGKFRFISILGIISQILYTIGTIVMVSSKEDLPLYILIYTIIPLFVSMMYYAYILKIVKFVRIRSREVLEAMKESIVYFVPTIAVAIYSIVDKTMLGVFDPTKESVGLYECAEKIVKVALAICTASYTIMRTRMSYLFSIEDKEKYRTNSKQFMSFSLMLCWPIMFGIVSIADRFVPFFFGPGYDDVVALTYAFSLVIPCLTFSGLIQAIYIFPFGLQKTMDYYYILIVSVNVVMNIVLINCLGAIGAIIASISAELLLTIILIGKAKKRIEVSFLFHGSVKYILSSIVMLVVIQLFGFVFTTYNAAVMILELTVGILVYFSCCIFFKDQFVRLQFMKLIQKVKKILFR